MLITEEKIRKTVIAICNSFASDALSMSTEMSIDEVLSQLGRGFRDANSKLHGILMLIDDWNDDGLYGFVESYIGRLKRVYENMTAKGKKLAMKEVDDGR